MTTGGTVNYTDGYGRAGGPNPALVKEHLYMDTSSYVTAGLGASATLLVDASTITGNSESFHVIYAVIAACDNTTPWNALLWETNLAHTAAAADAAVRFSIGASSYAADVISLAQPVKLGAGNGLELDNTGGASAEIMLTIGYNTITPTS